MRERDHLVVGRALVVAAEQLAIVLDELVTLGLEFLDRPLERLARLHTPDVFRQTRERQREIVVPRTVIMIETVADVDVEPRVTRALELVEPRASRLARTTERCQQVVDRNAVAKVPVDAELDRTP